VPNLTLSEELDASFITFSAYPTQHWLDQLLGVILRAARSWTRHDDEATSDAVTTIFEKLSSFKLQHPSGFSRWVSSVCARTRKRVYLARMEREGRATEFDEEMSSEPDDSYIDLSEMNAFERDVATRIIAGSTFAEAAHDLGMTHGSLRQKLFRARRNRNPSSVDM
jgi:DNA-directed RNA polymerase specialized sigma24 family protein